MSTVKANTVEAKKNIIDVFVDGLRKGWVLCVNHLLPNVVMAFAIIHFLKVLNVLGFLSTLFEPVMAIFGLPGEAVTVLVTTWFTAIAAVGVASALYTDGMLNSMHLAILLPGIFLMGAQVQYLGRILAVIGITPKYYLPLFLISVFNGICGMLTMRFILS